MNPELNPLPWEPILHAGEFLGREPALAPDPPSSRHGFRDCAGDDTTPDDVLSPIDIELIKVAYGLAIREARCEVCRHPFTSGFRIKTHDCGARGAWIVTVSSRCNGLRRHRSEAAAWVSNDGLRLGSLRRRR